MACVVFFCGLAHVSDVEVLVEEVEVLLGIDEHEAAEAHLGAGDGEKRVVGFADGGEEGLVVGAILGGEEVEVVVRRRAGRR